MQILKNVNIAIDFSEPNPSDPSVWEFSGTVRTDVLWGSGLFAMSKVRGNTHLICETRFMLPCQQATEGEQMGLCVWSCWSTVFFQLSLVELRHPYHLYPQLVFFIG